MERVVRLTLRNSTPYANGRQQKNWWPSTTKINLKTLSLKLIE